MTIDHPVAGIGRYVEEVGRHLRDLPRDERESIEADLTEHIRDAGCATYSQCIERLGPSDAYAAGLRDGMGLGEYRRPRRRPLLAIAVTLAVIAAGFGVRAALVDDPLDQDFDPTGTAAMSVVQGTAADTYGGGVQIVVANGGDARFGMVLTNRSDRAIDVTALAPAFTTWNPDGSASIGGTEPFGTRRPGDVWLRDLWDPDVRIGALADPQRIEVVEHELLGEPFAPFRWEPGDSYAVSVAGDVSPCVGEVDWLDGKQTSLVIEFSVGEQSFSRSIAAIGIDAEAC